MLYHIWYPVLSSELLQCGHKISKKLAGHSLLFGRTKNGDVFALRDICPHRGMPLSCGSFDGNEVTCCYHGWRFNPQGYCTHIPSLVPTQTVKLERIRTMAYACEERYGIIWIYLPTTPHLEQTPQIPLIPLDILPFDQPHLHITQQFPCSLDQAIVGLMDPAHGPFVHHAWWWRPPSSLHEKTKHFEPIPYGFKMMPHIPSKNSRLYRFLGRHVTTEISFQLPGVRLEHVRIKNQHFYALTTLTPVDKQHTEINQYFYWTLPWLNVFKPLIKYFAKTFLHQDYEILCKQQVGLADNPPLIWIPDADTQAKWYHQLKKEFELAQQEQRTFLNPLKPESLHWRS